MIENNWKTYKIKDIAEVVNGGTPKTEIPKYWNGDIPWLTPKDLTGYNKIYIERGNRNITKEGLNNSSAKLLPIGTVLLTSRAPIGYVAIAKNKISTNQGFKNLIINSTIANNVFIYYWIKNNVGYLKSLGTGTTFGELNKSTFENLEIEIPLLPEQKAIASVLSSLDDKIDLLHRQNKTLEQMAETLFRQWFVEEAKEDWEVGKLGDVINLNYGKGLKKEERSGKGYPVIGSSGIVDYHTEYLVDAPGIVVGRKGTLGKVIYLWDNFYPIDTTYYVTSKENTKNLLFEYHLLKTLNFEEMNSDSAVPGLNREIALSTEIIIPPTILRMKFNEIVKPKFDKIHKNQQQIHTLEKLRDTLLPKLMSGEVRVKMSEL